LAIVVALAPPVAAPPPLPPLPPVAIVPAVPLAPPVENVPPDETVPPIEADPPGAPPVAAFPPVELELAGPEELHAKIRKRQLAARILTGPGIRRMVLLRVSGAVLRILLYQVHRGGKIGSAATRGSTWVRSDRNRKSLRAGDLDAKT
jgi:hypothetical protein